MKVLLLLILELKKVEYVVIPKDKLHCFIKVYKQIQEQLAIDNLGNILIAADNVSPLYTYIIVKAHPKKYCSILK